MTIQQQFDAIVKKFNQQHAVPLGFGVFFDPNQKVYRVQILDIANDRMWRKFANVKRIPQLYSDAQAISIARTFQNIEVSDSGELISLYGNYAAPVIATM